MQKRLLTFLVVLIGFFGFSFAYVPSTGGNGFPTPIYNNYSSGYYKLISRVPNFDKVSGTFYISGDIISGDCLYFTQGKYLNLTSPGLYWWDGTSWSSGGVNSQAYFQNYYISWVCLPSNAIADSSGNILQYYVNQYSNNSMLVFRFVPFDYPLTYTITSPLGTTNIDQDITIDGPVSWDSGYPDYIVSNIAQTSVYYNNSVFGYTGSTFYINDIPNVIVSGGALYVFPDTPIANQFLTGFSFSGSMATTSGNVFTSFSQSLVQLFYGNIPSILIGLTIFMAIFFLVRFIFPKKRIKPF